MEFLEASKKGAYDLAHLKEFDKLQNEIKEVAQWRKFLKESIKKEYRDKYDYLAFWQNFNSSYEFFKRDLDILNLQIKCSADMKIIKIQSLLDKNFNFKIRLFSESERLNYLAKKFNIK